MATGAVDSPQATLIPLSHLRKLGVQPGEDVTVRRFDVGTGLHGDHIGGERDAARALLSGEVAAACHGRREPPAVRAGRDSSGRQHPGAGPDRAV